MSQYDDDFWSDGSESTGEAGNNGFETIPKNTRCRAHIEDIEWSFFDEQGENIPYVKLRWNIEAPSEYENRKIFQNIKLYGDDPTSDFYKPEKHEKTIENARSMFWAIDKNCGAKLAALKRKPKDADMQKCLIGKAMHITLGVTPNGNKNFVQKIEPLNIGDKAQSKPAQQKQAPKPQSKTSDYGNDFEDDGIPF